MLLIVAAVLLGVLARQCVSTDMYRLYNDPYQNCSSRVAYYESQAQQKQADAAEARAAGLESKALSYENIALQWQSNAETGHAYLNQQNSGAIALGVGALVCLLLTAHLLLKSRKQAQKAKEEPSPEANTQE